MNFSQPTPPFLKKGTRYRPPSARSRIDPLQGTIVLGRYRINSKLSQGGMSTVYLARNFEKGGLYAVKVLRPDYVRDQTIRERIINESRAVQRIKHPAVIEILEVGKIGDGQICLVMEYVHGSPLRKLVQGSPVKLSKVIPIVAAIAEGLQAAHAQGIIHRDLKPENVILPRSAKADSLVKIIDFGIARIIDAPSITTTSHIMGTPEYIAPEQALGQEVDQRTDIYGLGVIMYEMLTGALPFPQEDPEALLHHHVHTPPPSFSPSIGGEEIPEPLMRLVMDCLSKEPCQRPLHMGEILERLANIQ